MTVKYLTIRDLCTLLNLGRSTIYRRVQDGTLPAPIHLGKLVRWGEADILEALQKLEVSK